MENLEKIKSISPIFEDIFIKNIPEDASIEDKVDFSVQYISRTISYSENWFNYSFTVQAGINRSLSLKDGVLTLLTKDEIIVIGQGICGDISALAKSLGTKIGLDIGTEMVSYKTFGHVLNTVKLSNGKYGNIYITRLIRGDKTLIQCGNKPDEDPDFKDE